jgi:hypothetical protein
MWIFMGGRWNKSVESAESYNLRFAIYCNSSPETVDQSILGATLDLRLKQVVDKEQKGSG